MFLILHTPNCGCSVHTRLSGRSSYSHSLGMANIEEEGVTALKSRYAPFLVVIPTSVLTYTGTLGLLGSTYKSKLPPGP